MIDEHMPACTERPHISSDRIRRSGMLRLAMLLVTSIVSTGAAAELVPVREVVYTGKYFEERPLPSFDKGHLIFLGPSDDTVELYGSDGRLLYRTSIKAPNGGSANVMSAAIDTDGRLAAAVSYPAVHGFRAGIAFLDSGGTQTAFAETGRYLPTQICFAEDHSIWSLGWQRDLIRQEMEDREDYPIFRKYSPEGKELGSYIARSAFPPGLAPGGSSRWLWRIRAAKDRIGAIAYSGETSRNREWIEINLNGDLIGKWKMGGIQNGGIAYTADRELYARMWNEEKKVYLAVFDRDSSSWRPLEDAIPGNLRYGGAGLLMGADGRDLVFSMQPVGGIRLQWFRTADPATNR
jgi:hypothetical protein